MTQYHISSRGEQSGPFPETEVQSMLAAGTVALTDLCWTEGMADWRPIHKVIRRPASVPPPLPQVQQPHPASGAAIKWVPALVLYCVGCSALVLINFVRLEDEEAAQAITVLVLPLLVLSIVFISILHYQCWNALPERFRATTPGKAIGYLFIPLYNFYWAFVSWPKLADGLLEWQKSLGKLILTDARSPAISYAFIFVCDVTVSFFPTSFIPPGVRILINIASVVVAVIFYRQVVTTINEIKKVIGDILY